MRVYVRSRVCVRESAADTAIPLRALVQVAEEEESELERLKQYGRQMKDQAASRIDELDTLRKHQRDEEKRQREHEHVCFPPPDLASPSRTLVVRYAIRG